MTTKSELLGIIKSNLTDLRMLGTQILLEELIERKIKLDGVEQYRIHKLVDKVPVEDGKEKVYITSMSELLDSMTEDSFITIVNYQKANFPVTVVFKELFVETSRFSDEDTKYHSFWGSSDKARSIAFTLAYHNDNDKELPLKITSITVG